MLSVAVKCQLIDELTQAEHCGEKSVADLENEEDGMRLVVVLNSHGEHIQKDQHENRNFESEIERNINGSFSLWTLIFVINIIRNKININYVTVCQVQYTRECPYLLEFDRS